MQAIRAAVAADFDAVNQLVVSALHSDVGLVESIGHYIVDAGGKRLRPLLVLLTANALGYRGSNHIQLAAVVEFLHTATLLHDDVVDISSLRRGRPTANAQWGNAPSVLVGDFIYSRAFQLLVNMGDMAIMRLMADTTNRIAEGEVLQLERAGKADTSEQDYYQVIERKTAVLFRAATHGAAILSAADAGLCNAAAEYGHHLGMAFQLVDDVLDYSGDPSAMGKNVGDDLAEGKPTLPLIYTMNTGNPAQAALVQQAITHKATDNLDAVLAAVQSCGGLDYTLDKARWHQQQAGAALAQLPVGSHQEQMARLLDLAVNRDA